LPEGVSLLGRYWRGVRAKEVDPEVARAVTRAADAEPPVAWANHLLGHAALLGDAIDDGAERLLREGTYFPERSHDANEALDYWADQDAWQRIDKALADPRVARTRGSGSTRPSPTRASPRSPTRGSASARRSASTSGSRPRASSRAACAPR
jgi:hypothetical protein